MAKSKRRTFFLSLVALFLLLPFSLQATPGVRPLFRPGRALAPHAAANTSTTVDFALYDPDTEDDGVWEEEVTALKMLFERYGWTYRRIGADAINSGGLGAGPTAQYRALIAPGGYAYWRNVALTPAGDRHIQEFVNSGGHYVGFCAGAYWAARTVRWSETGTRYVDYPYELLLFSGVAQGPLGWMPWNKGTNLNYDVAAINLQNPTMRAIGMPATTRFLYGGGPWFVPPQPLPAGYEVWASAVAPSNTAPQKRDGNGKPTIVRFTYGSGTVILFSYHPDVLIKSNADGVVLKRYYDEDKITWKLGSQTQAEINTLSWNIVHAALAIAAGQTPTAIQPLSN